MNTNNTPVERKYPHQYKIVVKKIEVTDYKLFGESPIAEIINLAAYRRGK